MRSNSVRGLSVLFCLIFSFTLHAADVIKVGKKAILLNLGNEQTRIGNIFQISDQNGEAVGSVKIIKRNKTQAIGSIVEQKTPFAPGMKAKDLSVLQATPSLKDQLSGVETPERNYEVNDADLRQRNIKDLFYLTSHRKFYYFGSIINDSLDGDISANGVQGSESEVRSLLLKNEIGYGIAKNGMLSIGINYLMSKENTVKSTGIDVVTEESGLQDPVIKYVHRLFENKTFEADLKFEVSPKTGEKETALVSREGNGVRGGTEFILGGRFAYLKKNWTLGATSDLIFLSKITEVNKLDNSETETDSKLNILLGLHTQVMTSEKFFIRGDLTTKFIGEDIKENLGVQSTVTYDMQLDLIGSLGYEFGKDWLVGVLGLGYTMIGSESTSNANANVLAEDVTGIKIIGSLTAQF